MNARATRLVLGLAVGAAVVLGGIWGLSKGLEDRERRYQGKVLSYWIAELNSGDASRSNQAANLLTNQIMAQLTDQMFHDTNDSHFKMSLVDAMNQLPGVFITCIPSEGRRADAASQLGEIGPAASGAVPALIQAVKSNEEPTRGLAMVALGKIHSDASTVIPLLIERLNDPQDESRDAAASGLAYFGAQAKAAVPILTNLVNVPRDKDLLKAARAALPMIDPQAAAAMGLK